MLLSPDPRYSPPPPPEPELDLGQVRQELDTLAASRLRRAFDEREATRWDALIRLEQELLGLAAEPTTKPDDPDDPDHPGDVER